MTEERDRNEGGLPIAGSPRPGDEAVGLVCKEIWGGNRVFYGPIELPGIRGVLFSQPCDGARGGDVHYLSVCGSGLLSRACLADVFGHGESVASVSQVMHDLLRRSVDRVDERKVLRRLNMELSKLDNGSFTTAAALTYFPPTRRLSISYAGHEPAWYLDRARRNWLRLEPAQRAGHANAVLAAAPQTRYTRCTRRTSIGDRLLLLTDGVLEAPNEAGELFGHERLDAILEESRDKSPGELAATILQALHDHTNVVTLQHDDVSLLAVEFVENLKQPALWMVLRNRIFGPPRPATA
jgi:sigma-B regulation protein RsbU (phosphoserine phosphatase)